MSLGDKRALATQRILNGVNKPNIVKPAKVSPVSIVKPTEIASTTQEVTVEETLPAAPKKASFEDLPKAEIEKKALAIADTMRTIITEMKSLFVERDDIIESIMTALIAGQHALLLGPPGTGKSALATEVFKRIDHSRFFSHLMNRTSDPSEIVGPISIKSMEQDKFVRILDGKLGDCDIAFIDEIKFIGLLA